MSEGGDPPKGPPSDAIPIPVAPGPPADEPDAPLLPAAYDPTALNEAVGASTRPTRLPTPVPDEDDDHPRPPRNRRTMAIAAGSILVGLLIATLVFLGRANASRYLITCSTDHASAEQGRSFPPWGSHPLAGPEWKPIALPGNAECTARETDDPDELGRWYLAILIDRASTTLGAKDLLEPPPAGQVAPLEAAAAQLDQALLLARPPERRDERKDIERLQGDVAYWRAMARLRDASAALADAAKRFDTASAARPRHVADASSWAGFVRKLADELAAGPNGEHAPAAPPQAPAEPPHEPAPAGSALPVEPPAAAPPAPDAGVASGGVLL